MAKKIWLIRIIAKFIFLRFSLFKCLFKYSSFLLLLRQIIHFHGGKIFWTKFDDVCSFISDSCFTYYCDRIWAKRFSFSFERTCIMVRQNAFSKVAFSHVKIFAIDRGRRKYIFSKRTLLYCQFMKYAKKSLSFDIRSPIIDHFQKRKKNLNYFVSKVWNSRLCAKNIH